MGNPQGGMNHGPHAWSDGADPTHNRERLSLVPAMETNPNCAPVRAGQPCRQVHYAGKTRGLCGMRCDVPSAALVAREPAIDTCSSQGAEGVICRIEDLSTRWRPFLRVGMGDRRIEQEVVYLQRVVHRASSRV